MNEYVRLCAVQYMVETKKAEMAEKNSSATAFQAFHHDCYIRNLHDIERMAKSADEFREMKKEFESLIYPDYEHIVRERQNYAFVVGQKKTDCGPVPVVSESLLERAREITRKYQFGDKGE